MQRRMATHNYALPGIYHITLHVADGLGQPLGHIQGSLEQPDGSPDAPHVAQTQVGHMVREELLTSITGHYPMITIDTFVIMPEHLHALLHVTAPIVSSTGRPTHLGQVIAGFKKGCNRRYWALTGQDASAGEPLNTISAAQGVPAASSLHGAPSLHGASLAPAASLRVSGGSPAREAKRTPSGGMTGRRPLFAYGYCDVQPITLEQLATQRAYIKGNPRSRLLRMSNRAQLTVQRGAITTALTPAALSGYLQRECPPSVVTAEALTAIEGRLLTTAGSVAGGSITGKVFISCDTFGNRALLTEHRCLPVVCHRKDGDRFSEQKQRCLEEAAHGAVLVGTRIAPKEREIMDEAVNHGFPVITLHDNGFADRYHPSADRLDLCAADRLLIVSPWQYQYRGKNEQVTVLFCKAMNCVAQALCRTRDDWWK